MVHSFPTRRSSDLDKLSRPTLGFPADVMREASVVGGVYGAQLSDIDDPRAPYHHRHLVVIARRDMVDQVQFRHEEFAGADQGGLAISLRDRRLLTGRSVAAGDILALS